MFYGIVWREFAYGVVMRGQAAMSAKGLISMNGIDDIVRKRSILLTARLRFSPQIQPIKETALDKMIEQILSVTESERGLSLQEIQRVISSETGGYAIASSDLENSINRLAEKERIIPEQAERLELYRLSEEARRELAHIQEQVERRFNSVVTKLFKNAEEGSSAYATPLLEFLCIIFSQLGDEYVRVIKGEIKGDEFLSRPSIFSAFERIRKDFDSIDHSLFENAITFFFRDSNPDFDAIKWNMAQNYFVAKVLGLDPSGLLLSEEVFGNAAFYLDTNIIISALEPKDQYHGSFLALSKACKRLGIKLKVCQISLDELHYWLTYQRDLIEKAIDQIPKETAPKIRSVFYQIYSEKESTGETVDIDELFRNFDSPSKDLQALFEIELEDDIWFDEVHDRPETVQFAEVLRSRYKSMRRLRKSRGAALHDSMLLFWLQKLRKETDTNIWLITADTSLPGCVPQARDPRSGSLAITSDAVLQWISPIALPEGEEDEFPAIFAEMIRLRFLPPDRIFDLEDFLVFHELQMSCRELPAQDVEGCIRHVKANAPMLDPSDPGDRERLAYETAKFFAAPGRKYAQELERLEKDVEERDRRIEELERRSSQYEARAQKEFLKRSAQLRMGFTIFVFLMLEGLVVFLARQYGEGPNLFQKVLNSWPFFGVVVPAAATLMGWFLVGKERLKALGWPFTKVFKHEQ